eukprot:scaffold33647_cov21-Phaeocystis_antarctica.AAC.1
MFRSGPPQEGSSRERSGNPERLAAHARQVGPKWQLFFFLAWGWGQHARRAIGGRGAARWGIRRTGAASRHETAPRRRR